MPPARGVSFYGELVWAHFLGVLECWVLLYGGAEDLFLVIFSPAHFESVHLFGVHLVFGLALWCVFWPVFWGMRGVGFGDGVAAVG